MTTAPWAPAALENGVIMSPTLAFFTSTTPLNGVADLVRDYPPEDIKVLAPTANLIVRDDLHPALQALLLQAASEVNGKTGFFQDAGEFPAYMDPMLPLSPDAERYFKSGPSFLQRYLPFWLARGAKALTGLDLHDMLRTH